MISARNCWRGWRSRETVEEPTDRDDELIEQLDQLIALRHRSVGEHPRVRAKDVEKNVQRPSPLTHLLPQLLLDREGTRVCVYLLDAVGEFVRRDFSCLRQRDPIVGRPAFCAISNAVDLRSAACGANAAVI